MYEARQNKEKVSRRIDGGETKQRIKNKYRKMDASLSKNSHKVYQRTFFNNVQNKYYSSFDNPLYCLQNFVYQGDGGAVTIFKLNNSLFAHHIVALEWYDGINNQPKQIVMHLKTPELEGNNRFKRLNQISSILPGRNMSSIIEKLDWDLNRHANKEHKTRGLNEQEKENKRILLETEQGKQYHYNVLGGFSADTYNCKTWAEKVAPECR